MIELVVVMAIITLLAAVAYPSYVSQVRKSKRGVAKTMLLDAANREEQYFFNSKAYTSSLVALGYTDPTYYGDDSSPSSSADAVYKLVLAAVSSGSGTCGSAPCFQLKAIPQNAQANDDCGTYTITSSNIRGVSNSTSTPASECW